MIRLKRYSGLSVLETEELVNASLEEVWNFFSSPQNLGLITPPEMKFIITGTDHDKKSYAGQIISYSLNPFKWLKVNWVTEITHLTELHSFTDEQRFGPYKFWHHRHQFTSDGNRTIMKDIVTFKFPFGIIGRYLGRLIIEPRVLEIFRYRSEKINEIFR